MLSKSVIAKLNMMMCMCMCGRMSEPRFSNFRDGDAALNVVRL